MIDRRFAVLTSVVALMGCQSYRPTTGAPAPSGGVRVLYAVPTDVHAVGTGGSPLLLPRVEQLEGRVVNVRADTVVLVLMRTRPGYLIARPPAAPTVTVIRGPSVTVEALRLDPARTTGAVLGGAAAVAAILLLIFVVSAAGAYG